MIHLAETARVYPNVRFGNDVVVGDWVVVGMPPRGAEPGALETVIADGAVIRTHSVIYAGSRIGSGFQTGHRAILGPGLDIGDRCAVGSNSVVMGCARLRDGARIHSLCCVGPFAELQESAWVGPYCVVDSSPSQVTVVASRAILSLHVRVAPGVRVGERSLVGTRTFLAQDVPPYFLMMGYPPRAVGNVEQLPGKPYEPDPPAVRAEMLARHQSRDRDDVGPDSWRHQLWQSLGSPEALI